MRLLIVLCWCFLASQAIADVEFQGRTGNTYYVQFVDQFNTAVDAAPIAGSGGWFRVTDATMVTAGLPAGEHAWTAYQGTVATKNPDNDIRAATGGPFRFNGQVELRRAVSVLELLDSPLTEPSPARLAGVFSTYYGNNDQPTTEYLDNHKVSIAAATLEKSVVEHQGVPNSLAKAVRDTDQAVNVNGVLVSSGTGSGQILLSSGSIVSVLTAENVENPVQLHPTTTIATVTSSTVFTLTAGSPDDNAYNEGRAIITKPGDPTRVMVGKIFTYAGATRTITLSADPNVFPLAVGDNVAILTQLAPAPKDITITVPVDD